MKYQEVVSAVNQILSEYTMDLTLRQIYYRLVAGGLIPNRSTAYNSLSSQLVKAREAGEVDAYRIVDRSRRIDDISYDSPEDFLKACRYSLENRWLMRMWDSQPVYVEVWVEKDALSGVLADAVRDFNTIVAPSRGYSSYSYLRDAANRIERYCHKGDSLEARRYDLYDKEALILHFADHDPSGLDMSRDLEGRLARYCSAEIKVKRIALTFDQVQKHDLIPNPAKLADPRSPDYIARYGNECWELDAIDPPELIRLAQEAIEEEIAEPDAWEEVKEEEAEAKDKLREKLKEL